MRIKGLEAEVLGVEYGELCKYTVKLSFNGATTIVTTFNVSDKFSLWNFLVIWLDAAINSPQYCPWYTAKHNEKIRKYNRKCREEALHLFGSEKALYEYYTKFRRLNRTSSLS